MIGGGTSCDRGRSDGTGSVSRLINGWEAISGDHVDAILLCTRSLVMQTKEYPGCLRCFAGSRVGVFFDQHGIFSAIAESYMQYEYEYFPNFGETRTLSGGPRRAKVREQEMPVTALAVVYPVYRNVSNVHNWEHVYDYNRSPLPS